MDEEHNKSSNKILFNTFDFKTDMLQLTLLTEMFDNFSEAVLVANTERKMIYMNNTFAELFGYQKQELYGHQTKMLYADESDFLEQGNKRFNPDSQATANTYRVSYQRKGGAQFLGLTTSAAMRSSLGEVVGYIAIIRSARSAEQSLDTLQQIHNITSNVDLNYDQRVDRLLNIGLNHFGFEIAIISHITGSDYIVESCVDVNEELQPSTCFDVSGTYCVHTLQADKTIGFHFTAQSDIKDHPCYQNFQLESYIGTPIKVDGELYGTVNFSSHKPTEPFCIDDYILMGILADTLSFLIYKKLSEQELLLLASTDELTGLLNRRATLERLNEQAKMSSRAGYNLTIIFIDIDHFKYINDQWGHIAGDHALKGFSSIIKELGRETDFCGRIGGEEFIFAMPVSSEAGALQMANNLRKKLQQQSIEIGDDVFVNLTFSAGLAIYQSGESIESLLMRADQAMYQAKQKGRDQICLAEVIKPQRNEA
jgi:diguanylate cyclase (GGDEF)-like protein/PAS domain S-box-containing protein